MKTISHVLNGRAIGLTYDSEGFEGQQKHGGQQQATSQGSSDWRRNTLCVRVFRNSVITKVICISQNVIAVSNTARLVRHFFWLHPVPLTNPKKLWGRLSYLYVFMQLEIAQNRQKLLEIREVAKKLSSNLWKAVPDSENLLSLCALLYFLLRTIARDSIV